MDYEVFKGEIIRHLGDHLSIDGENTDRIIFLNDGFCGASPEEKKLIEETNDRYGHQSTKLVGDFILLKTENYDLGGYICRFEVRYLYDAYKSGGWENVDAIVDANIASASAVDTSALDSMTDYEAVKSRLILCLRNAAKTKVRYRDSVFQRQGDMAMILFIIVSDDGAGNRMIAPVPRQATVSWGKDDDDILVYALENSARLSPPRLYIGMDDLSNHDKGEFMAPMASPRMIPKTPLAATLTAVPQSDGAVAIYYPGVQERISFLSGGDYFVVPTGKDEVRIHPAGTVTVGQMRRGLRDTNLQFPDTMLTNNIFFYDSKKKMLRMV